MIPRVTFHDDECEATPEGLRDRYSCTEACLKRQQHARERDEAALEDAADARRKGYDR